MLFLEIRPRNEFFRTIQIKFNKKKYVSQHKSEHEFHPILFLEIRPRNEFFRTIQTSGFFQNILFLEIRQKKRFFS